MTSLANTFTMEKALVKIIFGCSIFICELIFKFFAALLKTFGIKKDDMIPFVRGCFKTT